ncbi:rhodanese-like domain-containing protein [Gallaecimonas sp. GXIMD1310]|uniref:rhodanese-like domain-containing protein n=1 Tax=Gallaecimonas sp. GXIMD1310 TaxID=3131926 RepID=UPI00324B6E98
MQHSPAFLALCEAARAEVTEVSLEQLRQQLGEGSKALLIDVREDHEWYNGHLPGAIHMGRGIIERDIEKRVPERHRPLYLYCGGGYRSALVAVNLAAMGYQQVFSVAGGYRGWIDKGWPVAIPED